MQTPRVGPEIIGPEHRAAASPDSVSQRPALLDPGPLGLAEPAITGQPKLLFLVTEDWYFWSHRLPVARAARVHALARGAITGNVGGVAAPIAAMFVGVVANAIHAARRAPNPPARIPHGLFALAGALGAAAHRPFQ